MIWSRFEHAQRQRYASAERRHPWWHGDLTPLELAVPDVDTAKGGATIIYADDRRCFRCVLTVHAGIKQKRTLTNLHTYYDPIQSQLPFRTHAESSDRGISRFVPYLYGAGHLVTTTFGQWPNWWGSARVTLA
ncbi:hypothetical protein DAEQUDRAFT_728089 [Daedalea quercina L-15889]|uniref:Uncharacterized protein n=1 Tax=Daedalea quercina L-15889 TaxID=1314783 RepID=A0A165PJ80_9APHY|nr:hypothetical protein DAEQUDRAFT_728089 [Daedalea quercina L-15889]